VEARVYALKISIYNFEVVSVLATSPRMLGRNSCSYLFRSTFASETCDL
jgi:hypothetical protein